MIDLPVEVIFEINIDGARGRNVGAEVGNIELGDDVGVTVG